VSGVKVYHPTHT